MPQPEGGLTWACTRPDSGRMSFANLKACFVVSGRVMPGVSLLVGWLDPDLWKIIAGCVEGDPCGVSLARARGLGRRARLIAGRRCRN